MLSMSSLCSQQQTMQRKKLQTTRHTEYLTGHHRKKKERMCSRCYQNSEAYHAYREHSVGQEQRYMENAHKSIVIIIATNVVEHLNCSIMENFISENYQQKQHNAHDSQSTLSPSEEANLCKKVKLNPPASGAHRSETNRHSL